MAEWIYGTLGKEGRGGGDKWRETRGGRAGVDGTAATWPWEDDRTAGWSVPRVQPTA